MSVPIVASLCSSTQDCTDELILSIFDSIDDLPAADDALLCVLDLVMID